MFANFVQVKYIVSNVNNLCKTYLTPFNNLKDNENQRIESSNIVAHYDLLGTNILQMLENHCSYVVFEDYLGYSRVYQFNGSSNS